MIRAVSGAARIIVAEGRSGSRRETETEREREREREKERRASSAPTTSSQRHVVGHVPPRRHLPGKVAFRVDA